MRVSQTQNNGRILLVGNIENAFTETGDLNELHAERCSTMLDAISIAAQKQFETIFIIVSEFAPNLKPGLKAIRQLSHAKIILLVQMYQEPFAIEIVNTLNRTAGFADDYEICPCSIDKVISPKTASMAGKETEEAAGEQESKKIEELTRLATEDDLTGLKNRRYAREFLRQIIERAKQENMQLTLLVFDIDNFKHYNDVYGHAAGDDILRQAATLMRSCCRKHDVVARIGGDEFAVIFWDAPKESEIESGRRLARAAHPHEIFFIAERFRRELNLSHLPSLGHEGRGVLTISGGLAGFDRDGSTVEELFEQADKALLEAKRSGKNRIYLVGEPLNEQRQ
jgi:diguanylate cyclase (GGDEF)-like protein